MLTFAIDMTFVFKWEGGYVNDPNDPGGETNYGISKRAYPNVDIKNLTRQAAQEIYQRDYWDAISGDILNPALACAALDCAINMGVGRAKQFLVQTTDWQQFIQLRKDYYTNLVKEKPALGKYLNGWLNRVNDLQKFIQANNEGIS
jgi:lysozyme family protein